MALIKCVKCNKEYSSTLSKCPACHYTPVFSYCPECNRIVHLSDSNCRYCGFVLSNVELPFASLDDVKRECEGLFVQVEENKDNKECLLQLKDELQFYKELDEVNDLLSSIEGYIANIDELEVKQKTYAELVERFNACNDSASYHQLMNEFASMNDFMDAMGYVEQCKEKYEESIYNEATDLVKRGSKADLNRAIVLFESISECKDSLQQVEGVKAILKAKAKKTKGMIAGISAAVIVCLVVVLVITNVIIPSNKYKQAKDAFDQHRYEEAIAIFTELGDYKDSSSQISKIEAQIILEEQQANYKKGQDYFNNQDYVNAANAFYATNGYLDSLDYVYQSGLQLVANMDYSNAKSVLGLVNDRNDASKYIAYCDAVELYNAGSYKNAKTAFESIVEIENSQTYLDTCNNILKLEEAEEYWAKGHLNSAKAIYDQLPKDFEHNGVSVSKRLSLLKKNSKFLSLCGKWSSSGGKMAVRQIHISTGLWDEWYANKLTGYTMEILCKISDDGKVTVTIDGSVPRYTSYSSLSKYLDTGYKYFDKTYTAKKLPSGLKVASNTKLTYKSGKITVNFKYTDKTESVYFNYRYTSNLTFKRKTKY